jgi:glycoside/pentoside/hexuronide:cation symporter, GPH family
MSEVATVETSGIVARFGRITFTTLAFYAVGEMPITMTMVLLGLFGLFFYNSVLGLPAPLAGLGFAAGLGLDAVLDPYIGYRSDRSQSRLGRRHSFMLVGALALGPCFLLLFSPPRNLGHSGLFMWLVLTSLLFRAAGAVYRIPYLSLGAELSQDYDERTRIIAIRSLFGLIGTGCAAGLSFLVFSGTSPVVSDAKLAYTHYPRLGLMFGLAMTVSALVAVCGTGNYRHAPSNTGDEAFGRRFFSGFRVAMANRAFRTVWFSFTIFFFAVVVNATLAVQYFTWYAHIRENHYLSFIQVSFVIGAFMGVLLWLSLSKRAEKRTLYVVGTMATVHGQAADRQGPLVRDRKPVAAHRGTYGWRGVRQRPLGDALLHAGRCRRSGSARHGLKARGNLLRHSEFRRETCLRRFGNVSRPPAALFRSLSAGLRDADNSRH